MLGICKILLFFNSSLCLFAFSIFSQLKIKRKTQKIKLFIYLTATRKGVPAGFGILYESEKQDDVLYQNNSQFACTYL